MQASVEVAKRNVRGKKSDEHLLEIVEAAPGLSQYELAKKLGWKAGHVDGSVRRLLNANRVFIRVLERNGRRVNLIYPQEHRLTNVLVVPEELLSGGNSLWGDYAFAYALDSFTIGISGRSMPEWDETSCFAERIPLEKATGKIRLKIPDRFWRFYGLDRRHRAVSVSGNNILVTVSGEIVEEKRYPS